MRGTATCDTSVLIPALASWHPEHLIARDAVAEVAALPAHVMLECYSVLTRLPSPHRISAADAAEAIAGLDMEPLALPADQHRAIVIKLGRSGIRGGAVYDALVAATARHHTVQLLTRDRRARATYDAMGVSYAIVG